MVVTQKHSMMSGSRDFILSPHYQIVIVSFCFSSQLLENQKQSFLWGWKGLLYKVTWSSLWTQIMSCYVRWRVWTPETVSRSTTVWRANSVNWTIQTGLHHPMIWSWILILHTTKWFSINNLLSAVYSRLWKRTSRLFVATDMKEVNCRFFSVT